MSFAYMRRKGTLMERFFFCVCACCATEERPTKTIRSFAVCANYSCFAAGRGSTFVLPNLPQLGTWSRNRVAEGVLVPSPQPE